MAASTPPHIAVIGSGVAGASTAFALARAGARVTVIDAALDGSATPAGAGIIMPWASSHATGAFYDLYAAGADYYPQLIAELAAAGVEDVDYRVTGGLIVNDDAGLLRTTSERLSARISTSAVAGTLRRVDADEAHGLFPPLRPGLSGLHLSGGARVDGRSLREGLLRAAAACGAESIEATAGLAPPTTSPGVPGVIAGEHTLAVDAVVVAAGVWTEQVLAPLGVGTGVVPQRGQILHLRADGHATDDWPSVHPLSDVYLVSFGGSRVVFGATREDGSGLDVRRTAAGHRRLHDGVLDLAPGLAEATVLETRVGLRPMSPQALPLARQVASGVWVNTGFGPAGLTMGPLVGERLARDVLAATA